MKTPRTTTMIMGGVMSVATLLSLNSCQSNDTNQTTAYIKQTQQIAILESEPASYKRYALYTNGSLQVNSTLTTDGPLADVYAGGNINASQRSLDISGKIIASNNLSNAITRSFDYKSNTQQNFTAIRALKVGEYLNTATLDEYYLLTSDGKALHKTKDHNDTEISHQTLYFSFSNNVWHITGDEGSLNSPLVCETNLEIATDYFALNGTLMVKGNLKATGELSLNASTPFNKALIVDNAIEVNKLVSIGRIHGSSTFTANGTVDIMGNAEFDGNITLHDSAKINFLDTIYKAALFEAQQQNQIDTNTTDTNQTKLLVDAELFSDVKGNNSVILFTFVEGNYLMSEKTLHDLIETNQIDTFRFHTYLYGASINYGAKLQEFGGLSPYYQAKHALIKKFQNEGYTGVHTNHSIDIAPSELYHTFVDAQGNDLGTYRLFSLTEPFDINTLVPLTQDKRDNAKYYLENKDQIELQRQQEAQALIQAQIQTAQESNQTNQQMIEELQTEAQTLQTTDTLSTILDAQEARIGEWVGYQELSTEQTEIVVEEVVVEEENAQRGFFKKLKKVVKVVVKAVDNTVDVARQLAEDMKCNASETVDQGTIWGVDWVVGGNNVIKELNENWTDKITIKNNGWGNCSPTSGTMVINYHRLRKGMSSLYTSDGSWDSNLSLDVNNTAIDDRKKSGIYHRWGMDESTVVNGDIKTMQFSNPLLKAVADGFGTGIGGETGSYDTLWLVPKTVKKHLEENLSGGYAYNSAVGTWNIAANHNKIKSYIKENQPVMVFLMKDYNIIDGSVKPNKLSDHHTVAAIGYKQTYWDGNRLCPKKLLPHTRWLLIDTTWFSRGLVRYDAQGNYSKPSIVTYVRSY